MCGSGLGLGLGLGVSVDVDVGVGAGVSVGVSITRGCMYHAYAVATISRLLRIIGLFCRI